MLGIVPVAQGGRQRAHGVVAPHILEGMLRASTRAFFLLIELGAECSRAREKLR